MSTRPIHAAHSGLVSESAAYLGVDLVQQALAVLALPVFFVFLSAADFGVITWSLVLAQIAMTLSTLGLDFAVLRLYLTWPEAERGALLAGATLLCAGWSAVMALGAHLLITALVADTSVHWTLWAGWAAGLLLGLRGVPLSVVRVNGALRSYALFVLGGAVVQVVLQVALVAVGMGPAGYMLGYAAGAAVSAVLALNAVRPSYAWAHAAWQLTPAVWSFTARILPSVLFSRFIAVADRVMVARWATLDALGIYGAASRFTTPLKSLTGGFKMALVPLLSREEAAGSADAAFGKMSQFVVLTMLLAGSVVAMTVWCVQFTPWASETPDLPRLVALLLVGQFLSGLTFLGQARLYYSSTPAYASLVAATHAVVFVAALAYLTPRFGADGAAVAAIAAGAAGFIVMMTLALLATRRLRPWSTALILLMSFLPTVVASWRLGRNAQLPIFALTLIVYAGAVGFRLREFRRGGLQEMYSR